jgi:MFS family permease
MAEGLIPDERVLWNYVMAMAWGSILVGWAIAGNAATAQILVAKFGWDEEETKLKNSMLGTIGLVGIMIGSTAGGNLITYGRRRAIFLLFVPMIIGITFTLFENFYTILIGRFITGTCAGVYQMANIKAVNETVPGRLTGKYGVTPGALLGFGIFLVSVIGLITLPTDQADYVSDRNWRVTYFFPFFIICGQLVHL